MKNLILFLLISVSLFGQDNRDLNELSRMVFDEINIEREKKGLLSFTWNDSLLTKSKWTNNILKKEKKLYHPEYDDNMKNYYEKILVNQYRKITKNPEFLYESADAWGFKRTYSLLGEIIIIVPPTTDSNSTVAKYAVYHWLKSSGHKYWMLIHDTIVYNVPYSSFCSCNSDYIIYQNRKSIIITCNMYIINIVSDANF